MLSYVSRQALALEQVQQAGDRGRACQSLHPIFARSFSKERMPVADMRTNLLLVERGLTILQSSARCCSAISRGALSSSALF